MHIIIFYSAPRMFPSSCKILFMITAFYMKCQSNSWRSILHNMQIKSMYCFTQCWLAFYWIILQESYITIISKSWWQQFWKRCSDFVFRFWEWLWLCSLKNIQMPRLCLPVPFSKYNHVIILVHSLCQLFNSVEEVQYFKWY